jgi:hypothetical protein
MSITAAEKTTPLEANTSFEQDALLARIRDGIIGKDTQIQTPFGARTLTYADYTASGRSLDLSKTPFVNMSYRYTPIRTPKPMPQANKRPPFASKLVYKFNKP